MHVCNEESFLNWTLGAAAQVDGWNRGKDNALVHNRPFSLQGLFGDYINKNAHYT